MDQFNGRKPEFLAKKWTIKVTDRNLLLISALAVAIAVGNIAMPLAMTEPDPARTVVAAEVAHDRYSPMKTATCALELTEMPAN